MPSNRRRVELPPTAGLPLCLNDFVRKPEKSFVRGIGEWLAIPEPVPTCSGTAALIVALHTLRQREPHRTDVILPAYTCPLVAQAVLHVPGLRVVLCDTAGIDLDEERLAALCTDQTLAVIPTHLGGRVAEVRSVRNIAVRHGAFVIEDAAQSLGALHGRDSVGLEGDIAFFSLAVGKGLTTYEGGLLFSRLPDLHAELAATTQKMLRPHPGWTVRRNFELLACTFLYRPSRLWLAYGRNLARALARGDEVAAVGDFFDDIPLHSLDYLRLRVAANALERLPEYLEHGRIRAMKRLALFRTLPVPVVTDRPDATGVWPFFMLLMPDATTRARALAKLWTRGLGVSKLFIHALPDYDFLAPALNADRNATCPNARDFADRLLTISNTHWLDDHIFALILDELQHYI